MIENDGLEIWWIWVESETEDQSVESEYSIG